MKTIKIYEDNAGNIFLALYGSPRLYQTDPLLVDTRVAQDCHFLCADEYSALQNWSEEWVHSLSDALSQDFFHLVRHIATWLSAGGKESLKVVEPSERIGRAGRLYLGLPPEEEGQQ